MTGPLYLLALLVSAAGVLTIDLRHRLVLGADARRGLIAVAAGAGLFLVWDVVAIAGGMYGRGGSATLTGLEVAPHLPIEEIVFVTFFSHLALVVHALVMRLAARGEDGSREDGRDRDRSVEEGVA